MPVIDLGSVVGPAGPQGATGATGAQGLQGNPGPNQVTNQTSTNLIGVLQGAASKITVKPVDEVPTINSLNLVTSGGVANTRIPKYGMGKNLLDNWYFVGGGGANAFPVNQRGQSSYTGGYTIDRWKSRHENGTIIQVASDGLVVKKDTQTSTDLIQIPSNQNRIVGKVVTLTVFTSAGLYTRSFEYPSEATTISGIGTTDFTAVVGGAYGVTIRALTTTGVKLYAIKLELGTEQTLCHNDGTAENPVWVLNEIPDYGEELRKCQRYFVRFAKQYGNYIRFGTANAFSNTIAMAEVPLPVSMRSPGATPTVSFSNIYLMNGQTQTPATAIAFQGMTANMLYLDITVASGLTQGSMYLVKGDYNMGGSLQTNGYLDFSCEP